MVEPLEEMPALLGWININSFLAHLIKGAYMTVDKLASAYVAHGRKYGFASAECVLMRFLPNNLPDGKCYNVQQHRRTACYMALRAGSALKSSPKKIRVESHE